MGRKRFKFGDKVWCPKYGNGVIGGNEKDGSELFVIFPDGVNWDFVNKLQLKRGWKKKPIK